MFFQLRDFLDFLRKEGDLIEIERDLSPRLEIPAAVKYIKRKGDQAILFKNATGYPGISIVGNLLGNRRRLACCLDCGQDQLVEKYIRMRKTPVSPRIVETGPVKDVVIRDVDLTKTLPVLTHHEKDAGPYITCGVSTAKHPETGIRGMGIHRIQVKGKNRIGIFLATPPLSEFFRIAEEKNQPLEIATFIGADPITFFSSVTRAPEGVDKFDIAGGLLNSPLELLRTESGNLEVPANAEFVLEGKILPGQRETEGPFGESTGYYFTYDNPLAEINCITHRKNPIFQALVPFASEEDVLLNISWESEFLRSVREKFPQVERVHFNPSSLGISAVIQIKNEREDLPGEIINEFLDLNPFVKILVLVDEDVNPEDPRDVDWAIATRVRPDKDMIIKSSLPGMPIDPSIGKDGLVGKMGIDATKPFSQREKFEKIDIPEEITVRIWDLLKEDGF